MSEGIGQRLAMIRSELKRSQQSIADHLGVALRTWQGIERGENVPSGDTLLKIAAIGYSPSWILTGQGAMRFGAPAHAGVKGPQEASTSLNVDVLAQALALVEEWLTANKRIMRADKKAAVVAQIYEFALEDETLGKEPIDSHRVAQFLRLVA